MKRTREEVDATLQIAKLNAAELLPAVHCLGFGPGASGAAAGDFCLLELEPTLCQQLEDGHSLVIRGDKDEQAVLCSKDKTYDLKIADTSNMLLFIPGCKTPDQLKKEDSHCNIIHTEYTTEDLLDQIQASEEEIMTQLQVLNACEIGGEVYFELDADKICRATAQMLLQNAVKFNLAEFQEVWQQSVPEGMITSLDQLKGLALVDRHSRPEIISLLKVDDLPEDNQERFNSLFSLREKWTEEDIAPYIQDLCGEKQTIGALLTKYSRSSMQNGVKVYNSRRPIS
ncbi:sister chromatid cohesion protein DCC1 isoform X4 [Macaca fascicularis]|uniref:sister chromatid cohesion protein DCC1 isoform X4 n=1 Tax=Macaca fascicularis TaxID=9541 RepID=UPI003D15759F